MPKSNHASNLIWIVAIVILLTFLIVVISWMSSGKLKVEKPSGNEAAVTESGAERKTFVPETGRRETVPSDPPAATDNPPAPVNEPEPAVTLKAEALPAATAAKEPPAVAAETAARPGVETPAAAAQPAEKKPAAEAGFALQVGAFSSADNAKSLAKKLADRGYTTTTRQKNNLTTVLITGLPSQEEARELKEKLARENISSSVVALP